MKTRLLLVQLLLVAIFGANAKLFAADSSTHTTIVDRRGVTLADTVLVDRVFFDRSQPDAEKNAEILTSAIAKTQRGLPKRWFKQKLLHSGAGSLSMVRLDLSEDARAALSAAIGDIPGVRLEQEEERRYRSASLGKTLDVMVTKHFPEKPPAIIRTTIDASLQTAAERAFGQRAGALVAIDVKTGAVLALVAMPLESGADLAIAGEYNPDSVIQPFLGLAALELGVRTAKDTMTDVGYYQYEGVRYLNREKRAGHGRVDMYRAIAEGCDIFFYSVAEQLGIEQMHSFLGQLGFGVTSLGLPAEAAGLLPSPAWKQEHFNEQWTHADSIAMGVGGYITVTPIQLARATALLASGTHVEPYLISLEQEHEGRSAGIKADNLATIKNAMISAARRNATFATAPYLVAGVASSAPVFTLDKLDHPIALPDHALFIGYAPARHSRIALAVVVHNGGRGAAAPIARSVFDRYLLGGEVFEPKRHRTRTGKGA